ncbi:hypothetical protein CTA2_5842 [Colletotrichum tanaceti]|uniref:Uncharacterized protein n=1 Tax=Colletotrichum tanaceti TaxID=1306861 RepID=A0A4U6XAP9_9PEZI|nr:hypothetical protein CTA2_5842 [Colletotrichum tanaceti]TKW52313.1 hypothetical protein CTA1_3101 [Colletotrichum tanaceti]
MPEKSHIRFDLKDLFFQERNKKWESAAPDGNGQKAADKEKKVETDIAAEAAAKSRERAEGNENESRGEAAEGRFILRSSRSNVAGSVASGLRVALDSLVSSSVVEPVRPAFSRLLDDYAAALLKKQ